MRGIRRSVAGWLVEWACEATSRPSGDRLNRLAASLSPGWSVPWYNLGFSAKYAGDWSTSLVHNRRAAELDPSDEASWWNLGIAATALRDWETARLAWAACGIELSTDTGEPRFESLTACVRLNPEREGEVVWGHRIDPVRLVIDSIPLPESRHRYRDMVLHDGAQEGTREIDGVQVPVFDELELMQASCYSTFEALIVMPASEMEAELVRRCLDEEIGIEDWSTIRRLCEECSRGNPAPHMCSRSSDSDKKSYGFACEYEARLRDVLQGWAAANPGARFDSIELRLRAEEGK